MDERSESVAPVRCSFLAPDGRLNYACLRPDERHYATSTRLLNDCLWHGSECDDWNLLVPPFTVSVASGGPQGGTDG